MKRLLCPVFFLFLSGCTFFSKAPVTNKNKVNPAEILLQEQYNARFAGIETSGELRAAVYPSGPPVAYLIDGKLCGSEKEKIELLSTLAGWKATFSVCSRREAIAFVRNGKADICAGGFTAKDAEQTNLTAVCPHRTGGQDRVFLISPQAEKLKNRLQSFGK